MKAKMAVQGTISNYYQNADLVILNKSNNKTLKYAGVIGLASVVLNDCGHTRWHRNFHSKRWAERASWLVENTLFENGNGIIGGVMSSEQGKAGYAEGPHYFYYAFDNLAPYIIAYKNFINEDFVYKTNANGKRGTLDVKNFDFREDFHNLYQWYNEILMPKGRRPPYDNSWYLETYPWFFKLLNNGDHYFYEASEFGHHSGLLFRPQMVASLNTRNPRTFSSQIANHASGDLVLQTPFNDDADGDGVVDGALNDADRMYMHVLSENGSAVNGGAHEHADPNSFIIAAGNEMLIIDPPYFGYPNRSWVDHGRHHNIIRPNHITPFSWSNWPSKKSTKNFGHISESKLVHTSKSFSGQASTSYEDCNFTKDVSLLIHETRSIWHFKMVDSVDVNDMGDKADEIVLTISGNGSHADNPVSFQQIGEHKFVWKHPCVAQPSRSAQQIPQDEVYQIEVIAVSIGGLQKDTITRTDVNGAKDATINGNLEDKITLGKKVEFEHSNDLTVGFHTKLELKKISDAGAIFETLFVPFRCDEEPPLAIVQENEDDALICLNDTSVNGAACFEGISNGSGSVHYHDPLYRNINESVHFHGNAFTLTVSNQSYKSFQECKALTKFRFAALRNGDTLKYNDTTYIAADDIISVGYDLSGKFKYEGYIINDQTTTVDVSLFLPDLDTTVEMIVRNAATYEILESFTYNKATRTLTIETEPGTLQFEIEPEDPCLVSCFFPEKDTTIYKLFNFNTGSREYLGHHLDIIQDTGHLRITNGSKMIICSDQMLANKDSITMWGNDSEEPVKGYPLPPTSGSSESGSSSGDIVIESLGSRLASRRSMIIVEDRAALILESNSHTHIGSFSTIYLKEGGTLLIEDSCEVEIGGEGLGSGEIIAESGAFVCAVDSTDLHFYASQFDSSDKNVFFVSMKDYPGGTKAAVNVDGINGKFKTDSLYGQNKYFCISFCELKNTLPPDGINNREFGWSNISSPLARIKMQDTFCEDSNIPATLGKTLNETRSYIKISRIDTNTMMEMPGSVEIFPDTILQGWDTLRVVKLFLDELYTQDFEAGNLYRLVLSIENDCGESSDTSHDFWIDKLPVIQLSTPSGACPGFETVSCNGTGSSGGIFQWSVSMLENNEVNSEDTGYYAHEQTFSDTSATGAYSNMTFPGYRFYGGHDYEIVLEGLNYCGIKEKVDVVNIPLSANLTTDITTIIFGGNPDSAQLTGVVTSADTFFWTPTTGLSSSTILTPKCAPSSNSSYILTANDGGTCTESDTILITVNQYAYAGNDSNVCYGDSVMIGSSMSIPPNYYFHWTPTIGLSDSAIDQPKASPTSTTKYTLEIRDDFDVLIEFDEVNVIVSDTLEAGFVVQEYTDSVTFLFENRTEPYDAYATYKWYFGDGDSSLLINPAHEYNLSGDDSIYNVYITLLSSNLCGVSVAVDSIAVDTTGEIVNPESIPYAKENGLVVFLGDHRENNGINNSQPDVNSRNSFEITKADNYIILRPNPFKQILNVDVRLNSRITEGDCILEVLNVKGQMVRKQSLNNQQDITVSLDFTNEPTGLYYVRLVNNKEVIDIKKAIRTN